MIFPIPVKETYLEGSYTLTKSYPTSDLYTFYTSVDASADFIFESAPLLAEEEYEIIINEKGITVKSSCETGKFRALTSIYQMVSRGNELQYCEIADKPQFPRRSYMLDISRSKIPSVETILGYIDILAALKYNEFQLYMESFCFKYAKYPKVTADFDCLTPEDINLIEKYCADRFIDLVPNQNSFGHMAAWLRQDEFKHLGLGDGTNISGSLNPLLPESVEFVDGLYESLLPHFSSEYVNVGFDEAYELGKYQTEEPCKKYGKDTVFMDYLNKIADLARDKYGKKIQFWDDMIVNYPSSYNRIPEGAVALEWGYELIQSQIMAERCINFKKNGIKFYVCPSVNTHLSFTGRFDVTSFNLRTAGEVGRDHGAMGYMVTDWGNTYNPHFPYASYVPAALAAQYAWNVGGFQNGENFKVDMIYAAEAYSDEFIFGAKLSKLLYRLANYYLLEPERVHCGTMCGHGFYRPVEDMKTFFSDLDKCGDVFYFNNVDRYVREIMEDIKKVDMDETIKREILCNSEMVLFANMLNAVRVRKELTREEYEAAKSLAASIESEFIPLWDMKNYPIGKERFLGALHMRTEELAAFVK